jgi:AcrR family transcriptional regulator/DNA-binding MarR family transcriptional regulator
MMGPSGAAGAKELSPGARVRVGGEDGLPRDQVSEVQRARMLSAVVDAVAEVGYAGMSVAQVIDRAGVSRRTFYELFESREDCFVAAFDETVREFGEAIVDAYERESSWLASIRAALATLLTLCEREPAMAWLCIVESWGAGERTLGRCAEVSGALAKAVDRGRREVSAREPSPVTGEGLVGGVVSVVHSNLVHRRRSSLMDLLAPLMSMIALPYLGPSVARRELQRSAPEVILDGAHPAGGTDRLLDGVSMRLTYRTLLVLSAIDERPGSSNSEIAAAAGVADQGQISKLLKRLEELELVENAGDSSERGAPNAWSLTAAGERIVHSIEAWREAG